MEGCEKRDCPYCKTIDEDRVEYCCFYGCTCWSVRKCWYLEYVTKEH